MKQLKFNDCKINLPVFDNTLKLKGIITECTDIHNVCIEYYNNSGSGLYCLDENCKDYDNDLFLIT